MNIAEIKESLAIMKPRQQLYEAVKDEMKKRGRWRLLPRGKAFKGGEK